MAIPTEFLLPHYYDLTPTPPTFEHYEYEGQD